MTLNLTIWCLQSLVITIATAIAIVRIGFQKEKTAEKRFILPYCILDFIAILLLNLSFFVPSFEIAVPYITCFFALCELTLIPMYIKEKMGEPKNIFTSFLLFILLVPFSTFFLRTYNEFTFLVTNLYISFYVFKYILWLFEVKAIKNLQNSPQYFIIQGIAICYIGSTPYFISSFISHFFANKEIAAAVFDFQYTMFVTLNICMFLLFIKAFLMPQDSQPAKVAQPYVAGNLK